MIQGLTEKEAQKLKEQHGDNEIKDVGRTTPFTILIRQIRKNFIIYLLLVAAILSFIVGKDITAYTILAVVMAVVISGFIQEYKAEKAIESLRGMLLPFSIVIRNGKEKDISSKDMVPGDAVILGSGERIPADCVVLEANELRVDESVLTGESVEVKKFPCNGTEDANKLFMGTFIVRGRCVAQVLHIGMSTRFGEIAAMISRAEKEIPLQTKVNQISKYMAVVAITVSLLTAGLMLFRAEVIDYQLLTNVMILAIALSVSAFPEGFPVVLTTALATGMVRMARKNAIVNRMSIIETLGETTVICTDKTGTVTKGEMTIKTIFSDNKFYEVAGSGYVGRGEFTYKGSKIDPNRNGTLSLLLRSAALANDARIQRTGQDAEYRVLGTPTEGALLILAAKAGVFPENLKAERLHEEPFSSERKMMSALVDLDGQRFVFAAGAPEILLEKCTKENVKGEEKELTKEQRDRILSTNQKMNSQALRTLVLAYKPDPESQKEYSEGNFIFLGIVGMEDAPREDVAEALKDCQSAGITVKMITGDSKETAISIGKQIGLEGEALVGLQIDELSDQELVQAVKKTIIFARVRPEHKLRIVRALKEIGEIVTMTGDGVNDAPALKEAHIGVAMGKSGTDVSRSVSDLVLKDDNFATIVSAIKEGRTVFNNIRKFASYQLSCNLSELLIIFTGVALAPAFGWATPLLLPLHILFMNLITDNLPAITLGLNPYSKDVMNEPPRKDTRILSRPLFRLMVFNGFLMGVMTLAVYYISFNLLGYSVSEARTTALVTLIVLEIASAFNFRSFRYPALTRSPFVNPYLAGASAISIAATLAIIYWDKARVIFETAAIGYRHWLEAGLAGLLILVI
ncbi:MAG: cation-transporting P-type ATPase, partial [candidate division WWE3 bacterium]|nr:cation-transporting P-type ATPase [candidate division WWE3 bacterium]